MRMMEVAIEVEEWIHRVQLKCSFLTSWRERVNEKGYRTYEDRKKSLTLDVDFFVRVHTVNDDTKRKNNKLMDYN